MSYRGNPVNWATAFVSTSALLETSRYRDRELRKKFGKREGLSPVATTMRNSGPPSMSHVNHISRPRSLRIACLAALAGGIALLSGPGGVAAEQTRSDRCSTLQDQLADQVKAHPGSDRSAKATTMGV